MSSDTSFHESLKALKRLKNEPILLTVIIAIILFVSFFVIWAIIKVVTLPTLADYAQLFTRTRWLSAIKNSLFMTFISTISCTSVAFLFAYVNARLNVPCKGIFKFVALLPIVSPPFIAAINVLTDFGNPMMIGRDLALLPTEAYMQISG